MQMDILIRGNPAESTPTLYRNQIQRQLMCIARIWVVAPPPHLGSFDLVLSFHKHEDVAPEQKRRGSPKSEASGH